MRFTIPALLFSAALSFAQSPADAAFKQLKNLAGDWEGTGNTRINYRLGSGGTTVIETINGGDASEMITVYHRDGNSILMTHYCMVNNQPRMRATPKTGEKSIHFDFVDVSNLKTPEAGHMRTLQIHFDDADHIRTIWGYREKGKDSAEEFKATRKK